MDHIYTKQRENKGMRHSVHKTKKRIKKKKVCIRPIENLLRAHLCTVFTLISVRQNQEKLTLKSEFTQYVIEESPSLLFIWSMSNDLGICFEKRKEKKFKISGVGIMTICICTLSSLVVVDAGVMPST